MEMADEPDFDVASVHEYFSVTCFNRAWELIEKPDRTPEDDEDMVRLSLASHWHWTQRQDCTVTNASVGYWQTSRIYAILGSADNARRYGHLCLAVSKDKEALPFCLGYAYEALARAELVAGDRQKMEEHLAAARKAAETIPKADVRKQLLDDLATIK
jgi:hypothetical protein